MVLESRLEKNQNKMTRLTKITIGISLVLIAVLSGMIGALLMARPVEITDEHKPESAVSRVESKHQKSSENIESQTKSSDISQVNSSTQSNTELPTNAAPVVTQNNPTKKSNVEWAEMYGAPSVFARKAIVPNGQSYVGKETGKRFFQTIVTPEQFGNSGTLRYITDVDGNKGKWVQNEGVMYVSFK